MKLSTREKKRLRDRYGSRALVSGATSGIGFEITCLLASAGFDLLINARSETQLQKVSNLLGKEQDIKIEYVVADMSGHEGVRALQAAADQFSPGLVVLAAGFGTSGLFADSILESELNMLNVNCVAVLKLTHYFCQQFRVAGRGGIILLSSILGFQGTPYAAHYAATKAYIQSLAESLHVEMKPFGVDVLAAAPGPVLSGFEKRAGMRMKIYMGPDQVASPVLNALGRKQTVLPGWLSKVLVYALRTVPRTLRIAIMKNVMKGMVAHQVPSR